MAELSWRTPSAAIVTVAAFSVADRLIYWSYRYSVAMASCLAIKAGRSLRPQPAPTSISNTLPLNVVYNLSKINGRCIACISGSGESMMSLLTMGFTPWDCCDL